ncbi:MAG: hypothetical protein R6V07_08640, partial [Armatimonadota bacterium]
IDDMPAPEANRLHVKTNAPPAFLTEHDAQKVAAVRQQIEKRLDALTVGWLLERFKALPRTAKQQFLREAQKNLQ